MSGSTFSTLNAVGTNWAVWPQDARQAMDENTLLESTLESELAYMPPDDPDRPGMLEQLADLYNDSGEYHKSASYYYRAIEASCLVSGPDSIPTAGLENKLGVVMYRIGRPDEGARLYQHALAITSQARQEPTQPGPSRRPSSRPTSAGRPQDLVAFGRRTSALAGSQPQAPADRQPPARSAAQQQPQPPAATRPARRQGPSQVQLPSTAAFEALVEEWYVGLEPVWREREAIWAAVGRDAEAAYEAGLEIERAKAEGQQRRREAMYREADVQTDLDARDIEDLQAIGLNADRLLRTMETAAEGEDPWEGLAEDGWRGRQPSAPLAGGKRLSRARDESWRGQTREALAQQMARTAREGSRGAGGLTPGRLSMPAASSGYGRRSTVTGATTADPSRSARESRGSASIGLQAGGSVRLARVSSGPYNALPGVGRAKSATLRKAEAGGFARQSAEAGGGRAPAGMTRVSSVRWTDHAGGALSHSTPPRRQALSGPGGGGRTGSARPGSGPRKPLGTASNFSSAAAVRSAGGAAEPPGEQDLRSDAEVRLSRSGYEYSLLQDAQNQRMLDPHRAGMSARTSMALGPGAVWEGSDRPAAPALPRAPSDGTVHGGSDKSWGELHRLVSKGRRASVQSNQAAPAGLRRLSYMGLERELGVLPAGEVAVPRERKSMALRDVEAASAWNKMLKTSNNKADEIDVADWDGSRETAHADKWGAAAARAIPRDDFVRQPKAYTYEPPSRGLVPQRLGKTGLWSFSAGR